MFSGRLRCALALSLVWQCLAQAAQSPEQLKVVVLEGEGAINNIRLHRARDPVVEVRDQENRAISGATVTFLLPDTGASASFLDGSKTLTLQTGEDGRATAKGMRPNNAAGQFEIRVTASYQGHTGSAVVTQTNAVTPTETSGSASRKIAIIAAIGAAIAGGVLAAGLSGRGGGNGGGAAVPTSPAPVPVTVITPGSPTLGPPQ